MVAGAVAKIGPPGVSNASLRGNAVGRHDDHDSRHRLDLGPLHRAGALLFGRAKQTGQLGAKAVGLQLEQPFPRALIAIALTSAAPLMPISGITRKSCTVAVDKGRRDPGWLWKLARGTRGTCAITMNERRTLIDVIGRLRRDHANCGYTPLPEELPPRCARILSTSTSCCWSAPAARSRRRRLARNRV